MAEKEKSKLKTNKNISLKNKKNKVISNKDKPLKVGNNINNKNIPKKVKINNNQKNAIKKRIRENIKQTNIKNTDINLKSNIKNTNSKNIEKNFNLKNDTENTNLKSTEKNLDLKNDTKNTNLKSIEKNFNLRNDTKNTNSKSIEENFNLKSNTENINLNRNIYKSIKENISNEKSNKKLKFKEEQDTFYNNEDVKDNKTEDVKEPSYNEFKADIKNLKLEAEKTGLEFDKANVERKIRKNYGLKFIEKQETIDENGKLEIKNKFIFPRIEQKGFKYKDGLIRKSFYRADDLTRGKIHSEINKTEDDNTTVKALHTSEKFIERKIVSFVRNTNNRRIKKYNKLENKISKIKTKQTLNSLKVEFKDDKQAYKQAFKDTIKKKNQKKKYQKMMMRKVNKAKFVKRFQNTVSNVLAFKSNPLTYLLSFKGILVSIVLFFAMMIFYLIVLMFSSSEGIGNIYEIQKAEIYYRELEANLEYNSGVRLDHDPIDLASFLVALFGEFEFDEDIEKFLAQDVFQKHQQGKSLEQIISDFLPLSDYENYLYLYDVKCNYMKYGSPFNFEYEPYISSYVGYRINPTSADTVLQLHKGLDIAVAGGTEILAISDGIVTRANYSESYGNIVEILHDDGYISKYAHQERLNVSQGQRVSQGDVIGYVGTTGDSTGNHLHLELYDELGEFMNPIYFIARDNERSDENSN